MDWLKRILGSAAALLKQFFKSPKAAANAQTALEIAAKAMPYIAIAADIVARITPTTVDDAVMAMLETKFPALFSGKPMTAEELKLYALAVASELIEEKFGVDTSTARSAAQLAYLDYREVAAA